MITIGKTMPIARGIEHYREHHRTLLTPLLDQGIEVRFFDLPDGYPEEVVTQEDSRAIGSAHGDLAAKAVAEGCDAVALGCLLEPGVQSIRAKAAAPMIGDFRAAVLLALAYGDRVAFVGIAAKDELEELARQVGVTSVISGYYQVDGSPLDFVHSSDALCRLLESKAAEARDQGANVIVGYGDEGAIQALKRGSGLPVVSPVVASAIMAWSMAMNDRVAQSIASAV